MNTREDRFELADYLRVLWKRRVLIAAGTLVFTAAGVAWSLLLPEVYQASVTFLVEESKISEQAIVPHIRTYGKTYEGIIKNQRLMSEAVENFHLDKKPYNMNLRGLSNRVDVKTVRESKLIRMYVEFPEPKRAKDIANYLAEKAVELNATLSKADTARTKDFIKTQVDAEKKELDESEQELVKFKDKARLAELRKKIESLLARKYTIENELSNVQTAILEDEERLKSAKDALEKSDKTVKLTRKVAEDNLYKEYMSKLSKSDSKDTFNFTLEVEDTNPIYIHLEKNIVDTNSRLVAYRAKLPYLKSELAGNANELNKLQPQLINKEMELERLERAQELSNSAYKLLVKRYQEAFLDVASKAQELKILDPAVIPDKPIKPKKRLIVLVAGTVGLLSSLFVAFLLEYLGNVKKQRVG